MTESKQKKSKQKPKRRMRRANGVATRQRIFETASAMFAAGGFEATSLRQIASASSVDIATLKYHFRDKTELYSEVYRVGHENLLDHLKPCLDSLSHAKTKDELLVSIEDFVFAFHDFSGRGFRVSTDAVVSLTRRFRGDIPYRRRITGDRGELV